MSKFLDRHPGGRDLLLIAAGRDVTVLFNSYHAFSGNAEKYVQLTFLKFIYGEKINLFYYVYFYSLCLNIHGEMFSSCDCFIKSTRSKIKDHACYFSI